MMIRMKHWHRKAANYSVTVGLMSNEGTEGGGKMDIHDYIINANSALNIK